MASRLSHIHAEAVIFWILFPVDTLSGQLGTRADSRRKAKVIYSGSMQEFAKTCEAIGATTKKLQKTAIVAGYLKSSPVDEAAVSAVFLSGRPFPAWEEATLQ